MEIRTHVTAIRPGHKIVDTGTSSLWTVGSVEDIGYAIKIRDERGIVRREPGLGEYLLVEDGREVAWDRDETDSCEAGTPGCSIRHRRSGEACETW
jgi:hypothetical protein